MSVQKSMNSKNEKTKAMTIDQKKIEWKQLEIEWEN